MSKLLYRIGLFIYTFAIHIAALFNSKAKRWKKGRQGIFEQLQQSFTSNEFPVIWVHCASLGEFEQGRPIIESIKEQYPKYKVLLTFFSPSGYEKRKDYQQADWVFYLPADSPSNAQKFIKTVKPKFVLFVKYEFWYYYLNQLKQQKIPTYLISAAFRPKQVFFKWYGGLFREMLFCFQTIFVQNEASKKLLNSINYSSIILAGDSRVDRVLDIKNQAKTFSILDQFCLGGKVIVCGSTWQPDEAILANFAKKQPNYKLVIAPHEINKGQLQKIQQTFAFAKPLYYSQNPSPAQLKTATVLIIDNIGLLSSLYAYANIGYIGGGFGLGIHNSLEAVAFEIPVLFGANYQKFKEAIDLITDGIAFEINNAEGIVEVAAKMKQASYAESIAKKAGQYLEKNKGATLIILEKIAGDLSL